TALNDKGPRIEKAEDAADVIG
ncbi:MAG: hypothetical protein QOG25_2749, partial [Acetobacteraceae bacterium]|nr:hypothetical protein [Acetobacteraceae bacterium]